MVSELASARHLSYAMVGGAATWFAYQHENASAAARSIEAAPGELGGDFGNFYGSGATLAAGTACLWITGALTHSPNVKGAAVDLTKGLVVDAAVVGALKVGVGRIRPNGGHYSFPSGHASSAFTAAPILMSRFGWKVGAPAYAFAAATAFGRVEEHWHFPSDVIAGATIGLILGDTIARHARTTGVPSGLFVDGHGMGLRWAF